MQPTLSIVIPAFEEEGRLIGTLSSIADFIAAESLGAEVIVVDDGSRDRTAEAARDLFATRPEAQGSVIRYEQNCGKGYAVKTGLLAAKAEIALFSDADLSTPIEEAAKLVEPIASGKFDVTFGSRALDRSLIGTHQPWRREQGGRLMNLIIRTMSGLNFADTQCGFKAFNMSKFRPLLDVMRIDRFGFDVEFLYVANQHGLRLSEIPVRWNNVEGSKVSIFRDSWRMLTELAEIRRNARLGRYELDHGRETAPA